MFNVHKKITTLNQNEKLLKKWIFIPNVLVAVLKISQLLMKEKSVIYLKKGLI